MIKLKDLKLGKEYLIIDDDGYDDKIIKFKVVEKLQGRSKRGCVKVKFLKYIEDNGESDVKYYNDEDVIEKIYLDDQGRLFYIEDMDIALMCLKEAEKKSELEQLEFEIENHTPPEQYPDWDGDESIMYYIDNYVEEDEDCIDIEEELDFVDIDDLQKLLKYFNVLEDDIKSKLTEFWIYQGHGKQEIRKKTIGNYLINNFPKHKIISAMEELDITSLKDKEWFDEY